MSRKNKARKKQLRKEEKKKPKWHICAFVRKGCEQCFHASPHLVVPYSGELACGAHCAHHEMHTHCVRTSERPGTWEQPSEETLDS